MHASVHYRTSSFNHAATIIDRSTHPINTGAFNHGLKRVHKMNRLWIEITTSKKEIIFHGTIILLLLHCIIASLSLSNPPIL